MACPLYSSCTLTAHKNCFTKVKTIFFSLHIDAIPFGLYFNLLVRKKRKPKKGRCCRNMEGHRLWVRHNQEWGKGLILLPSQVTVLPESDVGSVGVKPTSNCVIQNR